jgi:hypothetical protein
MTRRAAIIRVLLTAYVFGSVVVVVPLVLDLAGDLSATTSGKVLSAALVALAVGAALALRDPWSHRVVIQMLIVFLSLAAVAILYRLVFEHHQAFPAAALLVFAIVGAVLFAVFYPLSPDD